jgi:Protein of unknown function (DUF1559)
MYQLGLGLRNLQDCGVPIDDIRDKNGKPLLSWRVAVLPHIEQDNIYKQFHLDEAWDSPHNRTLVAKMPKTFRHPKEQDVGTTTTHFQLMRGPGTALDGSNLAGLSKDSPVLASVGLMFETEESVVWTKPGDIEYEPNAELPGLDRSHRRGYLVTFADGAVRMIPHNTEERLLRAVIAPWSGQMIDSTIWAWHPEARRSQDIIDAFDMRRR